MFLNFSALLSFAVLSQVLLITYSISVLIKAVHLTVCVSDIVVYVLLLESSFVFLEKETYLSQSQYSACLLNRFRKRRKE